MQEIILGIRENFVKDEELSKLEEEFYSILREIKENPEQVHNYNLEACYECIQLAVNKGMYNAFKNGFNHAVGLEEPNK